jgi:hypothetical protein
MCQTCLRWVLALFCRTEQVIVHINEQPSPGRCVQRVNKTILHFSEALKKKRKADEVAEMSTSSLRSQSHAFNGAQYKSCRTRLGYIVDESSRDLLSFIQQLNSCLTHRRVFMLPLDHLFRGRLRVQRSPLGHPNNNPFIKLPMLSQSLCHHQISQAAITEAVSCCNFWENNPFCQNISNNLLLNPLPLRHAHCFTRRQIQFGMMFLMIWQPIIIPSNNSNYHVRLGIRIMSIGYEPFLDIPTMVINNINNIHHGKDTWMD